MRIGLSPPVRVNPFYRDLARVLLQGRSAPDACDGAQGLGNLGFVALVWRPDLAAEAQRALLEPHLDRCLGLDSLGAIGWSTICGTEPDIDVLSRPSVRNGAAKPNP